MVSWVSTMYSDAVLRCASIFTLQQGPPKYWYPTTLLQSIKTQKTTA